MGKNIKKNKKPRPTGKFKEFWRSARCRKLRGACYVLLAVYLFFAIVSFFFSWPDNQSNWMGSAGYHLANFLVQNTFGAASVGLLFLLFLYGLRLWSKEPLAWWRTFWVTLFWIFWTSTFLGWFDGLGPDSAENEFFENFVGVTGQFANSALVSLIGTVATIVLLVFLAIVFLVFVHKVKLRMPKIKLPERKHREADDDEAEAAAPVAKAVERPVTPAPPADPPVEDAPEEETPDIEEVDLPEDVEEVPDEPEKVSFSIDDEFARINQRAQGVPSEPTFTINGNDEDVLEPETAPEADNPAPETAPAEAADEESAARHISLDELYDPHLDLKQYVMPSTDMLTDWEARNVKVTTDELVANKDHIVETLHNYGIEIVEISASPGPTVTLYEIKPAPGIRISKIKTLEDDIALSLSAAGIRIIAPIPGRGTVGIEVPNSNPQIVSMKTMLDSEAFRNNTKMELPIAFGKTISNEPFVTDLAKMPHLLMAGATGTGKSVGLNAVVASLLYKKHPSELKFVMVDPKKVELSIYNKIERHYLAKLPDSEEAIITDVKKVVRTLNSLCIEMDQRYDLLKAAGVRKITEYNDKFVHRHLNPLTEVTPGNCHRYLPYIVLIVDEFADLIMTAGKEVEAPICRLAQLARAVGIHLIIATQRPTTNIITGTIKANFPARVAFKVTSAIDSRTILDCGGAQRLIGRGDMLISLSGSDLIRIQCALIETSECEQLAEFVGEQHGYPDGFLLPEYLDENEEPNKDFDPKQKDEFFNDAARLVVSSQFGSTSLLQRKLQLGYNRAGRIIDQLEAAGIVGPYNGSKARDVLVHDEAQLEEILRSL